MDSPTNLNNVAVFMHDNGYSTERNVTVAIMQALGLNTSDWRRRDKLILVGAPWIQAERESRQAEINRLQGIVDKNAKTADLLDRTLTALEKQLEIPLEAIGAGGK